MTTAYDKFYPRTVVFTILCIWFFAWSGYFPFLFRETNPFIQGLWKCLPIFFLIYWLQMTVCGGFLIPMPEPLAKFIYKPGGVNETVDRVLEVIKLRFIDIRNRFSEAVNKRIGFNLQSLARYDSKASEDGTDTLDGHAETKELLELQEDVIQRFDNEKATENSQDGDKIDQVRSCSRWTIRALILSSLGDYALALAKVYPMVFVAGIIAFGVAQFCFAEGNNHRHHFSFLHRFVPLISLAFTYALVIVDSSYGTTVRVILLLILLWYVYMLTTMVISAILRALAQSGSLLNPKVLGGIIFFLSDALIGAIAMDKSRYHYFNRFHIIDISIMVTYYMAQYLITLGTMREAHVVEVEANKVNDKLKVR